MKMRTNWQDPITKARVQTETADNGDIIVYRDGKLIARLLPKTFRSVYIGFVAVSTTTASPAPGYEE